MSELYQTFREAAGPHWFLTAIVIGGAAYSLVAAAETLLQSHGLNFAPTVPKVLFTFVALAGLLLFWGWKYAHVLRFAAAPKILISFEADGVGITQALVRDNFFSSTGQLQQTNERLANYVRIRIDAISQTNVSACTAAITKFFISSPDGENFEELALPQVIDITPPLTVRVGMPLRVDFLSIDEISQILRPTINVPWPLLLENVFEHPAKFRFEIAANDGRHTKFLELEVTYDGTWDGLIGKQIAVR